MSGERLLRSAVIAAMLVVTGLLVVYLVLLPSIGPVATEATSSDPGGEWPTVVGAYVSLLVAGLLVFQRPRNPIGLLLVLDVGFFSYPPLVIIVTWLQQRVDDSHLGLRLLAWTGNWLWVLTFVGIIFTLLLFPDGRFLSRRWRRVGQVAGVVLGAQLLLTMFVPFVDTAPELDNPVGIAALAAMEPAIGILAGLMLALAVTGGVALVLRYVRSSGVERVQMKWVVYAVSVTLVLVFTSMFLTGVDAVPSVVPQVLDGLTTVLPALGIGVAVLRYRLYDIDVVISRTLVFAVLAVFITGVYVAVVVGVGALLGRGDEPSLVLSIVATAIVAVAFEPVRHGAQRWANRVVFGRRASPYEVLARLTSRLAQTTGDEDLLERLAGLLADGTGATATVWLRIGGVFRPAASAGGEGPQGLVDVVEGVVPEVEGADLVVAVEHGGVQLGLLSLAASRGQQISPADERLVRDVAGNAGLLVRNVRLNAELAERAQELRASRRRLVAVQDQERRRLERDLHDGAQQQVVAAAVQLNLAKMVATREQLDDVAAELDGLLAADQQAVEQLRTIARGIYPPLLEAEGLIAAITGAARSLPLEVTVDTEGLQRLDPATEATTYFCVLEALHDAVHHHATRATVALRDTGRHLQLAITRDTPHPPTPETHTALTDRTHAHDGTLTVHTRDASRLEIAIPTAGATTEVPR